MGHRRLTAVRRARRRRGWRAAGAAAACALAAACAPDAGPGVPPGGAAPARVCSVSLAGDELLELLVPPARIACVSRLADDPETSNVAGRIPESAARLDARIEPVLAAAPDLVLAAPWNDRGFLELLAASGVRSVVLDEVTGFDGIRAQVLSLGRTLGAEEAARDVARRMDERLAALDAALGDPATRPRVLAWSHSVVAGRGTTVDALIARAGGSNAAAEAGIEGHRTITDERLLVLDPDVLLLGYDPGEDAARIVAANPQLARTRAARNGAIVVLPPRRLTTVSPHLVDGAYALAAALHPGRVGPDAAGLAP